MLSYFFSFLSRSTSASNNLMYFSKTRILEIYDGDNNLLENLTSYYDLDKKTNLINSIKIVNKKGEIESFEFNKYKF